MLLCKNEKQIQNETEEVFLISESGGVGVVLGINVEGEKEEEEEMTVQIRYNQ